MSSPKQQPAPNAEKQPRCRQCSAELSPGIQLGYCKACLLKVFELSTPIPQNPSLAKTWLAQVLAEIKERPLFEARYDRHKQLKIGGQGEIWRVRDRWLGRDLAMKRIQSANKDSSNHQLLFLQEAQIGSQLPVGIGALPVFDIGLDRHGHLFFTTAVLSGSTFGDVIRHTHSASHPDWTLVRALQSFIQICDTLRISHDRGLAHRDLKPSNVLIGELGNLYVIDWGSAGIIRSSHRLATSNEDQVLTSEGDESTTQFILLRQQIIRNDPNTSVATERSGLAITIDYTPPQFFFESERPSGHEMDIYASGVILYQLLTGELPYAGRFEPNMSLKQVRNVFKTTPHPTLSKIRRNVPPDLAAICDKAMAYEPKSRYNSMHEFAEDIRAFLEVRVVKAYKAGWCQELIKWTKRNRLASGALALSFVTLFALLLALVGKQAADKREAIAKAEQARIENERKLAALTSALTQATLHRRNGEWEACLEELNQAEINGYNAPVELALYRLEIAYASADTQLRDQQIRVLRGIDLTTAPKKGVVLLRLGEFELFDDSTWQQGVETVRRSLAEQLLPSEKLFAEGLIAESTTESLAFFKEAIELDPMNVSAHRHAFMLEILLGRQARVRSHVEIYEKLFSQDPTVAVTKALLAFTNGENEKALRLMEEIESSEVSEQFSSLRVVFMLVDKIAAQSSIDDYLGSKETDWWTAAFNFVSIVWLVANETAGNSKIRPPHLPSIRNAARPFLNLFLSDNGNVNLMKLRSMLWNGSLIADLRASIERSLSFHPEALLHYFLGLLHEATTLNRREVEVLTAIEISDHYQKATEVDCMYPAIKPIIRIKACEWASKVYQRNPAQGYEYQVRCIEHIHDRLSSDGATRLELIWYSNLAMQLNAPSLSIRLLNFAIEQYGESVDLLTALRRSYEADGHTLRADEISNRLLNLGQTDKK